MTHEHKPFHRTDSQKICDEVRNKSLHEDIAWGQHKAPQTMRELLERQSEATKENVNEQK